MDDTWLMQGDCLERMKEIPGGSVDMVMCDLPYGTTQNKWDSVIPFEPLWVEYKRLLKSSGVVVLTSAQPFTSALVMSQPKAFKYQWVWKKPCGTGFLNAKKQPLRNHEDVLVFYFEQPTYNPQFTKGSPYKQKQGSGSRNYGAVRDEYITVSDGKRYPLTVIEFNQGDTKVHPTQKPVSLMEYLIRTYTNESDTVLDNTMGSGTTGVACMNTNRKFIGIERDEKYFQIAKDRIEKAKSEKKQELF